MKDRTTSTEAGGLRSAAALSGALTDHRRPPTAETARLADELHDRVLPLLAVARQDVLEGRRPLEVVSAVDAAIAAVRSIILAEHPVLAERDDLPDALRVVVEPVCTRAGLQLGLDVRFNPPDHLRGLLLKNVRELVENVARHARATSVTIATAPRRGGWRLTVADDGVGFDHQRRDQRRREGHLGLARLEDDLVRHGGWLTIDTVPDGGTAVTLNWPSTR